MNEICRKDLLARNMNHMLKLFPKDYGIFPRTWSLPSESVGSVLVSFGSSQRPPPCSLTPPPVALCRYSEFQAFTRSKKQRTYICKPDSGCEGKGIFITKSSRDIPAGEHMICQLYISRVRLCPAARGAAPGTDRCPDLLSLCPSAFHHRRVQVRPAYLRAGDVM